MTRGCRQYTWTILHNSWMNNRECCRIQSAGSSTRSWSSDRGSNAFSRTCIIESSSLSRLEKSQECLSGNTANPINRFFKNVTPYYTVFNRHRFGMQRDWSAPRAVCKFEEPTCGYIDTLHYPGLIRMGHRTNHGIISYRSRWKTTRQSTPSRLRPLQRWPLSQRNFKAEHVILVKKEETLRKPSTKPSAEIRQRSSFWYSITK